MRSGTGEAIEELSAAGSSLFNADQMNLSGSTRLSYPASKGRTGEQVKIEYTPKKFKPSTLAMIEQANVIIADYQAQGFELTLRQLYYQFVSRDLIPNTQRSYKILGSAINDGRLAGLIDWEAIVDRTRNLQRNSHWDSPAEIVETCVKSYAIDKWADQENRPEVWIEKDALAGVIEGVCRRNDVSYFSCRGYTSQSEMHAAALRLMRYQENGQTPVIIHLGDHDPSGVDMTRDIQDRLELFTRGELTVNRIALNMDQIRKHKPPPNPSKITDPRATGYLKIHGRQSWELDALEPKVLDRLIERTIMALRDDALWEAAEAREAADKDELREAAERMGH